METHIITDTALIRFVKNFFSHCLEFKQMPSISSISGFQFLFYLPGELMMKTYKQYGLDSTMDCFLILNKGEVVFKTQDPCKDQIFEAYNVCAEILDKHN